jgi:hypothetical protein
MENNPGGICVKRINEMSLAFQQASVLWAGIELELFTRIWEGAATLGEIAKVLGARPEMTDRLLAACVALGPLESRPCSPTWVTCLPRDRGARSIARARSRYAARLFGGQPQ